MNAKYYFHSLLAQIGFALLATATGAWSLQAQVVANASFELPVITPADNSAIYNPVGGVWDFIGPSGIVSSCLSYHPFEPPSNTPDGCQFAFLQFVHVADRFSQDAGEFSQTVSVPADGQYSLTYFVGGRGINGTADGNQLYAVFLDGVKMLDDATRSFQGWTPKKAAFSATKGNHVLTFIATSTSGDHTAFFDAVSIQPPPLGTSGDFIYWSTTATVPGAPSNSKIKRARLDGSNIETVLAGPASGRFGGIAFDAANGHLYSGDGSYLFRANLNGSGRVNLVDSQVTDVEIDLSHGKVYWCTGVTFYGDHTRFYRANLDGTEVENIINLGFNSFSEGFAVDSVAGRIYWACGCEGDSYISVANLDGTGVSTFRSPAHPFGAGVFDVEIDTTLGKLYWNNYAGSDVANSRIQKANLDGSGGIELVLSPPEGFSNGLHFDARDQKVYYLGLINLTGPFTINRINPDGTGLESLVTDPDGPNYIEVLHSSANSSPTAKCKNVAVSADSNCSANASVDDGSFDPDGDTIRISQSPPGPYPLGATSVTLTVTDTHGAFDTCVATVTVNDTTAPTVRCPANIVLPCSVDLLVPSSFAAAASDNCDAAPSVTYSQMPGSGFAVGETPITCTATDASGNHSSCTFTVTRSALGFTGFLSPIGGADATGGDFGAPLRTFKLGSTIPVKFSASCGGSAVLTGVHTLQVRNWSNQTDSDPPIDATPTDAATTGNQFRLTDGEWHFNLDTRATGMTIGQWQFIATLSDGSRHSVWVQIK